MALSVTALNNRKCSISKVKVSVALHKVTSIYYQKSEALHFNWYVTVLRIFMISANTWILQRVFQTLFPMHFSFFATIVT